MIYSSGTADWHSWWDLSPRIVSFLPSGHPINFETKVLFLSFGITFIPSCTREAITVKKIPELPLIDGL